MAPQWAFLVSASIFLSIGEIANMVGVVLAVPLSKNLGKKSTYMLSMAALAGLSILFFFLPPTAGGYWTMLGLQIVICVFSGVMSPLIWSMYADVADYTEFKEGTSSTGLIFSSASMAQKFGGALGGSAVMWLLAAFGYNTIAGAVQTEAGGCKVCSISLPCRYIHSPCCVADGGDYENMKKLIRAVLNDIHNFDNEGEGV